MTTKKIRYAVVGLGHVAQAAVLPAFEHANENSELCAFVSANPEKITELAQKYGVKHSWSYDQYDECLNSGKIDAVYIALPNNMHCEFTLRAAQAKIHVLCEKPMALTEEECRSMIEAAETNNIKLMVAYRLHFDEANMTVTDVVRSGEIGIPKIFNSVFTMQLREGNIRSNRLMSGGPLHDIGIYCLNAARYIFSSEPVEVFAFASKNNDERFSEIYEMCTVIMRFSDDRLASFTCSFGASPVSHYQVVGTKGSIIVDPAFEYVGSLKYSLKVNGNLVEEKTVPQCDQFAPELIHFSYAVLENSAAEPSGEEGLADVRIIEAIEGSLESGIPIKIEPLSLPARPSRENVIKKPAVHKPNLVAVESASKD